jgi:hypothetical protein
MKRSDNRGRRRNQRGNAVIEASLLMPWVVFLFLGAFDFGFYAHALISTENAARAAALYTSTNFNIAQAEWLSPAPPSQPGACQYVLGELRKLPNVGDGVTNCNALPVRMAVAQPIAHPDGSFSTRVSVTYQTVPLFALPWMPGRLTMTRSVEMRIAGD